MTQVILEGQARVLPQELLDSKLRVPPHPADSYLCYPSCMEGQCRAAQIPHALSLHPQQKQRWKEQRPRWLLTNPRWTLLSRPGPLVALGEGGWASARLHSWAAGGREVFWAQQLRSASPGKPSLFHHPPSLPPSVPPSLSPSLPFSLPLFLSQTVLPQSSDWPGTHYTCRSG